MSKTNAPNKEKIKRSQRLQHKGIKNKKKIK